jgi:polyisoprenoid-binding protein YceI
MNKLTTIIIAVSLLFISCTENSKKKDEANNQDIPKTIENAGSANGLWIVDKDHSKLAFIVDHHGITEVDGYFKKFNVKVTTDKEDLSDVVFDVSVETGSIFTDLEERDNELKDEDLFNSAKFPLMTFKSTSFKKIEESKYSMQGDLTIKGTTKQIALDVQITGPNAHPNTNNKSLQFGIKAVGVINRSDFGVGGKLTSAFVSDEVKIKITGGFEKRQ